LGVRNWSTSLRKQGVGERICGDRKEGGTVDVINLRNKELRNLYSLPNVIC